MATLNEWREMDRNTTNAWWKLDDGERQNLFDAALEQLATMTAERDAAREALDGRTYCLCGCDMSDHEHYDEDGYSCGHDDHECVLVWRTVYVTVQALRAERDAQAAQVKAMREALEQWLPTCNCCGNPAYWTPDGEAWFCLDDEDCDCGDPNATPDKRVMAAWDLVTDAALAASNAEEAPND